MFTLRGRNLVVGPSNVGFVRALIWSRFAILFSILSLKGFSHPSAPDVPACKFGLSTIGMKCV